MDLESLKWDADGLLPVVIANALTGAVLTLAYANRDALQRTIAERSTWLYSRSRHELWHKGATSGNTQRVQFVRADCDGDALLYGVIPAGPACHTGAESCFFNELLSLEDRAGLEDQPGLEDQVERLILRAKAAPLSNHGLGTEAPSFTKAIEHLAQVLQQRKTADPEKSYVAKLYARGVDKIGKKIGEEATEVVIAAKNGSRSELKWEAADLLFHLLVLLEHMGVSLDDVGDELLSRVK